MMLNITIAQLNPIVGDFSYNIALIQGAAERAKQDHADILLLPELVLCGYPPEDLLLRPAFLQAARDALMQLIDTIDGVTVVVGMPQFSGEDCFNAAFVFRDGEILGQYQKMSLPNEGVFDECRYFTPGAMPCVFSQNGVNVGVLICEDVWSTDPAAEVVDAGAELVLVLNASPFHAGKSALREQILGFRVEECAVPFVYCNAVGGQDALVFDGASFALNKQGEKVIQLAQFAPDNQIVIYVDGDLSVASDPLPALLSKQASVYQALVLAVQDYVRKNKFSQVLLGLSGGIDSALTLAIAVDALGAENVHAVMMPTRYTADISLEDSRKMVQNLGVAYEEITIEPLFTTFLSTLAPQFAGLPVDATEENLQARIRGTLLMALSNKFGKLVLTTGNKSEMSVGYATLYGDMAGGFAVLKDVPKTLVYALAAYRNSLAVCIPERIITRPASAELRDNQTDQDSLPDYAVLDAIVEAYVEKNQSIDAIIAAGLPEVDVRRVVHLIKLNEYKRQQSAVGPRITQRAYGKDWRYPITQAFK